MLRMDLFKSYIIARVRLNREPSTKQFGNLVMNQDALTEFIPFHLFPQNTAPRLTSFHRRLLKSKFTQSFRRICILLLTLPPIFA